MRLNQPGATQNQLPPRHIPSWHDLGAAVVAGAAAQALFQAVDVERQAVLAAIGEELRRRDVDLPPAPATHDPHQISVAQIIVQ